MRAFRRIVLVVFLCGVAIGYLYLHNWSLRLTGELADAEVELRLLEEQLAGARAEVELLAGFGRLDSVWERAGRPGLDSARLVLAERRPAVDSAVDRASERTVAVAHDGGNPVGN